MDTKLIELKEKVLLELHRNPDDRYWQIIKLIVECLEENLDNKS